MIINIAKSLTGKKGEYSLSTAEEFMLSEQVEKQWSDEEKTVQQAPIQTIEEMKQVLYAIARHSKKVVTIKRRRKK